MTTIDDGSARGTDKNMSDYLRHGKGRDLAQHPNLLDGTLVRAEAQRGRDLTKIAADEGYEQGAYGRREARPAVATMTAIGCPFASGIVLSGPTILRGYSLRESTTVPVASLFRLRENDQNGKVIAVVARPAAAGADVTVYLGEAGLALNGLYLEVANGVPEGSFYVSSTE